MIQTISVAHVTFETERPFDAVVAAFECEVGSLEDVGWASIPAAATDLERFEVLVRSKRHYLANTP